MTPSDVPPDTLHPFPSNICFRVQRELSSGQLVPSGDLWPRFLYRGHHYNPENPWEGLFRGRLLVSVSKILLFLRSALKLPPQAYKHIFTSPSSVDGNESRATRSCNARIHGMKTVTIPSIAYAATQVNPQFFFSFSFFHLIKCISTFYSRSGSP